MIIKRPFKNIRPFGPFLETSFPTPTFKSKTFKIEDGEILSASEGDPIELSNTIENPGTEETLESEPESRGSSFSFDATFAHLLATREKPQLTILYRLDKPNEIPFFYTSVFDKEFAEIDSKTVGFEIPFWLREAEVVLTSTINPDNSLGAFIHNPENIDQRNVIDKINNNFRVMSRLPKTNFVRKVKELDDKMTSVDKKKNMRIAKPYNKAISEFYGIEFEKVIRKSNEIFNTELEV